jgi:hypothetical protein
MMKKEIKQIKKKKQYCDCTFCWFGVLLANKNKEDKGKKISEDQFLNRVSMSIFFFCILWS